MLKTYWKSVLQGSWGEGKGEKNGKQQAGPSVWRLADSSAIPGLLLCASSVGTPCLPMIFYRRYLAEVFHPSSAVVSSLLSLPSVATREASLEGVGGA